MTKTPTTEESGRDDDEIGRSAATDFPTYSVRMRQEVPVVMQDVNKWGGLSYQIRGEGSDMVVQFNYCVEATGLRVGLICRARMVRTVWVQARRKRTGWRDFRR